MRPTVVLASMLVGCAPASSGSLLPTLDPETFAVEVQPRYELHCAYVGCHGTPDRPLALYARGAWRSSAEDTPEDVFGEAPLRPAELAHNLDQTRAFLASAPDPSRSLLLLRPLAPEAGGSGHGGGVQFASVDDPDYRALLVAFTEDRP